MNFLNKISTKIFIFTAACCVLFTSLLFFINQTNLKTAVSKITRDDINKKLRLVESHIERNVFNLERAIWNIDSDQPVERFDSIDLTIQLFLDQDLNFVSQTYSQQRVFEILRSKDTNQIEGFLNKTKDLMKGYLRENNESLVTVLDLERSLEKPLVAFLKKNADKERTSISIYNKRDFFGPLSSENYDFLFVADKAVGEALVSEKEVAVYPAILERLKINTLNNSDHFAINQKTYYFKKIRFLDALTIIIKNKNVLETGVLSKKVFVIGLLGIIAMFFLIHMVFSNLSKEIGARSKKLLDISQGLETTHTITSTTTELVYLDVAISRIVERFKNYIHKTATNTNVKSMVEIANKANMYLNAAEKRQTGFLKSKSFFRASPDLKGDFYGNVLLDGHHYYFGGNLNRVGMDSVVDIIGLKTTIKLILQERNDASLEDIVEKINSSICAMSSDRIPRAETICRFIILKMNRANDCINYINCGFPNPILVSKMTISSLNDQSIPLGIREQQTFKSSTASLFAGDEILSFSHGLLQLTSSEGDRWNMNNLITTIQDNLDNKTEIDRLVLKAAARYSEGTLIDKDISLCYIKIDNEWDSSLQSEKAKKTS